LPANGVLIRPGKMIMSSFAKKTNAKLRKEGVDVIEIDTDGLSRAALMESDVVPAESSGKPIRD
jgi:N-dimethylarginine dimethylaminohydrolase